MAFDAFLKLDGIKGESTDAKHKDEIDVLSYHWGVTQAGGKPQPDALTFTTRYSTASPALFVKCAAGEHIAEGQLTLRRAGGDQVDFLKIKLGDILVSGYETGGEADGDLDIPLEEIALNFTTIEFEYARQKEDGSLDTPVRGGFDFGKLAKT